MTDRIDVQYSTWDSVATANPTWALYYRQNGEGDYEIYTGHEDFVFISFAQNADKTAFETDHKTGATAVASRDDAVALLVGLSVPRPRNPDGSRITANRLLVLGQDKFTRTDDGSSAMNVNGEATGAANVLWNGSGGGPDAGGDWTPNSLGSETVGSGRAGDGWDTGVAALDDKTRWNNGSLLDVKGLYSELRFWIQPKAYPAGAKLKVRWRDAGVNTGNQLKVDDYVTNMDLDVWQQVVIPIDDFGLTGDVDELQFKYTQAAGQHFWIDDMELIDVGGGPYRFRVAAPDANTRLHVSMLVLLLQGPDTGWNSDSFATISSGIGKGVIARQRRLSDGEVIFSVNSQNNADLFGRYHPQESFTFADNNTLVGFMLKPGKASIVVTDDEVLEFVVRDDLSSLTNARAYIHYGIEDVTP
jgi:hypothetical protein